MDDFGKKDFSLEDYNPKSIDTRLKSGVSFLAENFAAIALVFSAAIIIATTWLDIDIRELFSVRFATDAVLTMILYCTVQLAMQDKGAANGKLDNDYRRERGLYLNIRERIISLGSPRIEEFCAENAGNSLRRRRIALLSRYVKGLSYEEWFDRFSDKSLRELKRYARHYRRRKDVGFVPTLKQVPFLWRVNSLSAKVLTPEMMILEDCENWTNDSIAPSPRMVLRKKSKYAMLASVVSAVFVVSLLITLIAEPTWENFLFALIKLFFLFLRAAKGYSIGSLAYSVSGVAYHISQRAKCEEYLAWVGQLGNAENTADDKSGDVAASKINTK